MCLSSAILAASCGCCLSLPVSCFRHLSNEKNTHALQLDLRVLYYYVRPRCTRCWAGSLLARKQKRRLTADVAVLFSKRCYYYYYYCSKLHDPFRSLCACVFFTFKTVISTRPHSAQPSVRADSSILLINGEITSCCHKKTRTHRDTTE